MQGLLSPLTGSRAEVSRVSLAEAIALGPAAWDVVLSSGPRSPFMSWEWHRAWAESAPLAETAESTALLLRDVDGSLRALLPLRRERLRFRRVPVQALTWAIGDIGCPDELDVAALPDAAVSDLAAALDAMPWQVLILNNLAEAAPNAAQLATALAERGHVVRRRPLWICPRLELPASWDAYLASLSAHRRQFVRRNERGLSRDHAVALADYGSDRLDEGWSHLMRLHEQRWNDAGGGAFRDPRAQQLHRRFARELASRGRLWLSTLDVDGRPAAAWYGFVCDDTVYFYQGGRDPTWERESVGLVLLGMMIRRAIDRGYRAFSFLRGDDPYKKYWTSSRRQTHELVVFRTGWRGRWLRALDTVAGWQGGASR